MWKSAVKIDSDIGRGYIELIFTFSHNCFGQPLQNNNKMKRENKKQINELTRKRETTKEMENKRKICMPHTFCDNFQWFP